MTAQQLYHLIQMILTAQALSNASPAQLWGVVSAVTRWPDHLPTFDAIDAIEAQGDTNVGRQFSVRQPGLPAARYEITEWTEGSAFTWVARSPGVRTTARHTVLPHDHGCALVLTVDWDGPLAPLVRLVAGRRTQRYIDIEANTLARVAETHE